ncbi:MAG: O-antigen ligase family protein, partial [candidate division Zixibacteria bacterium]|nr:O-antigen ligase family protein [candidate division Zixibacteria bacterium]
GGLLATQSRLSMLFALGLSLVVLVLSLRRARHVGMLTAAQTSPVTLEASPGMVFRRAGTVVALASAGMLMLLFFRPGIMDAVTARFTNLLSSTPSETTWLRLGLWKFAWSAFADNPLLGIGPGCFRSIQFVMPTAHLETVSVWVRGLSAHNLFLHYLAETGIVGATALVALFANQYRLARRRWKTVSLTEDGGLTLALYVTSLLFLVTTFIEAGWLWGQTGFAFVFFAAIIVRYSASPVDHHGHSGG